MGNSELRMKLVKKLVRDKAGWVMGGYENSRLDGNEDPLPPFDAIVEEIYDEVMQADWVETNMGLVLVQKDIRFVGKATIMHLIKQEAKGMVAEEQKERLQAFLINAIELKKKGICPFCKGAPGEFRDELSKKEFQISGLCQKCQDDFFEEE
jgi:hypothetical protein